MQQRGVNNHVNLVLFLLGTIFTFACFYSSMTVLPLYVNELGGTEFDTGVQITLYYIASVLLRFYFGPLSDRKGRKLPLMIGAFVFATSSLLFVFCDTILEVTLARLYQAVGLAAFFSSGGSLIADLAPAKRIGLYVSLFRMSTVTALLTGPFLAMLVIDIYHYSTWFIISTILGFLSLLFISLVKAPPLENEGEEEFLGKFVTVLKEKATHQVLYGISLVSLSYGLLLTFVVLFIVQDGKIANPGLYFTYFSIVSLAGTFLSGNLSDRIGRPAIVWPAITLLGIGVGMLYFVPQMPALLWVSSVLAGIGYSASMASLAAWLVEVVSAEHRGTAVAMQESTIDISIGIASFIFGWVSGFTGMGGAFALIGGFVFLSALVKMWSFCQAARHKS
ncbi:MFS transporter [Dehalobacterium formicoaceticum]|uniref:MFS transporter n=1 Tax=Dehalobacterium formicoaceticum TaxID=51515 RepID=A0ABT1Y351_9FIRM|nr:MFS transporter [Dehalobacterium formicoaceticum]MCR6545297.1 MFS transporter [Dehalobacterium formicoaceticum]